MTSLPQLVEWAKGIKQRFPQHRDEIWSFISLCQDEIEEGSSEAHEVQLAYNDICDLVGIDE
jgi:hypothetical protein